MYGEETAERQYPKKNTNNILTKCQHSFIRGRSCVTQLLAVLDIWTEIMDRRGNIDCIYLDFSKAFDSVPHRRMLHKLQAYGTTQRECSSMD